MSSPEKSLITSSLFSELFLFIKGFTAYDRYVPKYINEVHCSMNNIQFISADITFLEVRGSGGWEVGGHSNYRLNMEGKMLAS